MMRLIFLFATLLAVASCATIEGVGRDISSGARSVERMF